MQSFQELRTRFRIKYVVEEPYRFAAHLDRVRAFYRSLRRSELPVAYTKGFAPKPMLSFGPPLPVGLVSSGEYLDVFTAYHYTGNIVRDLGTFLPKGLRIAAARAIAREHPTLGRVVNLARYDIALPEAFDDDFAALVERSKGLAGVKDLLPGAGYDRRRDMTQSSSIGIVSQGGSSSDRVTSQGLASCPKPLATIVVDLAIGPGIRLFDALAHIFNTSDTEARCLSIGRRDCLVAQNGRIRTPLED